MFFEKGMLETGEFGTDVSITPPNATCASFMKPSSLSCPLRWKNAPEKKKECTELYLLPILLLQEGDMNTFLKREKIHPKL